MKTVVIVDDEFGLADTLAVTLADVGFRALTAADGIRGLEVMREQPPDLVILDYMMPRLDGPGVLAAMATDPKLASVPVIMITAMSESAVAKRCTGYVSFLRKPFTFEAVLDAVERAIGRSRT